MALDFQQVYEKIKMIGATVQQRKKTLETRRARARALLDANADALEVLARQVESAKTADPNLRCALPFNERLDAHVPPPTLPEQATLIAADGSQINPDRHNQVQYGLINVGAVVLKLSSGEPPDIVTDSQLLFDEELFPNGGPLTDGMVALRRDLKERSKLDELAKQHPAPVVTFTDGPVELWAARDGEDAKAYERSLTAYLSVLSRLQERDVITAGYVDKPAADLVVRLLEIADAAEHGSLENIHDQHPLQGVTDRWLFGDRQNPLLGPGQRSAVFALQSRAEKSYQGVLSLHFFYVNVGSEGHPWIARVEVPKWVAGDLEKLGLLHAVLIDQCRTMGPKPYPYLLHRAHETAVVSQDEKAQVEALLLRELRSSGDEVDEGSYKQSAKDLPKRTSY
jgi:hypothetical protein